MADRKMQGAGAGAASGAFAGAPMGPYGALGGGLVGSLMGYLGASDSKVPIFDQGAYNQRQSEINSFEAQLKGSQQNYMNSLSNFYNIAYNQYGQNATARFGANGIGVDSGAYASALAREGAMYSSQGLAQAYQGEKANLSAVDAARAGLYSSRQQGMQAQNMFNAQANAQNDQQLGSMVGGLAQMGMQGFMARGLSGWGGKPPLGQDDSGGYGVRGSLFGNPDAVAGGFGNTNRDPLSIQNEINRRNYGGR